MGVNSMRGAAGSMSAPYGGGGEKAVSGHRRPQGRPTDNPSGDRCDITRPPANAAQEPPASFVPPQTGTAPDVGQFPPGQETDKPVIPGMPQDGNGNDVQNGAGWLYPEQKSESALTKTEKEKKNPFEFKKKLGYTPTKHMYRLARVFRSTDVRSLISSVNANIVLARRTSGVDKKEVKQAVAQMEQVIQRARVKMNSLEEEAQTEAIGKRAVKRQEMEKARKIAQELKRRRTARTSREYGQAAVSGQPRLPGMGRTPEEKWEDQFSPDAQDLTTLDPALTSAVLPANPTIQQVMSSIEASAAAAAPAASPIPAGGVIDVVV